MVSDIALIEAKLAKPDYTAELAELNRTRSLWGNVDPYIRAVGTYYYSGLTSSWPNELFAGACDAAAFGGLKYGPGDWRNMPHDKGYQSFRAAASRHAKLFLDHGMQLLDEESKLPHVYHFACNVIFAEWHRRQAGKL